MTHCFRVIYRKDLGSPGTRPVVSTGAGEDDLHQHIALRLEHDEVLASVPNDAAPHHPAEGRSGDEWSTLSFDEINFAFAQRPELPTPDGPVVDLTVYPDGSEVVARNEADETFTVALPSVDGVLTLTDPGKYWVEVRPPFPWMPVKSEITVA